MKGTLEIARALRQHPERISRERRLWLGLEPEERGQLLQIVRERLGLTLVDAAEWVGVCTRTIRKMERNPHAMRQVYFELILQAYHEYERTPQCV